MSMTPAIDSAGVMRGCMGNDPFATPVGLGMVSCVGDDIRELVVDTWLPVDSVLGSAEVDWAALAFSSSGLEAALDLDEGFAKSVDVRVGKAEFEVNELDSCRRLNPFACQAVHSAPA